MHLTVMTNLVLLPDITFPLRDKSHYDRLWYAIRNNYNDTIGSDHAPHLKENKLKEYPNHHLNVWCANIITFMLNHE